MLTSKKWFLGLCVLLGACYYTVEGGEFGTADGEYRVYARTLEDTCAGTQEAFYMIVDVLHQEDNNYTVYLGASATMDVSLDDEGRFKWDKVGFSGWATPTRLIVEGKIHGGSFIANLEYFLYDATQVSYAADGGLVITEEATAICRAAFGLEGYKRYVSAR